MRWCHHSCKECYGVRTSLPAAGFIYHELRSERNCGRCHDGWYFNSSDILRLLRLGKCISPFSKRKEVNNKYGYFLSLVIRSLHFLRQCLGFGTIRYPWSLQCLDSHRSVSRAEVPGQLLRGIEPGLCSGRFIPRCAVLCYRFLLGKHRCKR